MRVFLSAFFIEFTLTISLPIVSDHLSICLRYLKLFVLVDLKILGLIPSSSRMNAALRCAIQGIQSILRYTHISKASSFLIVQVSAACTVIDKNTVPMSRSLVILVISFQIFVKFVDAIIYIVSISFLQSSLFRQYYSVI